MNKANAIITDMLAIVVRLAGLILLFVGLYIGLKVIFEAWHIYQQPQRIERFANAIEQGSQLDALLISFSQKKSHNTSQNQPLNQQQDIEQPQIRLTYFIAWGVALVLLMVVGSLASAAIRTGGQLALYDLQVKHFARQLLKEAKSTNE